MTESWQDLHYAKLSKTDDAVLYGNLMTSDDIRHSQHVLIIIFNHIRCFKAKSMHCYIIECKDNIQTRL